MAGQVGSRLEGNRAVNWDGEHWRGARDEAELVGDASAGERVDPLEREPRPQGQRAFEARRACLFGRDALGSGGLAGSGQADRDRPVACLIGVQPERDWPFLMSAPTAVQPDGSSAMHGRSAAEGTACADSIMG